MDRRRAPPTPSRRDVVFCHECEHDWFRDEHGLTCPECHSDFTEIVCSFYRDSVELARVRLANNRPQIEPDNDPRTTFAADDFLPPASFGSSRNSTPFDPGNVSDPDVDDIGPFSMGFFPRGGPGTRNPIDPQRAEVNRNFQNTFSGLLSANTAPRGIRGTWTTRTVNLGNGGTSAPSPPELRISRLQNIRRRANRWWTGTMTFSSGTLFPRDPNGPQPGMIPVDNLSNILSSLLMNMHGLDGPAGPRGPGGFRDPMGMPAGPPMNPIGALFNALFNPAAAQHGDAVYTQEALDRVITQLMEQNATGNAPGPASAEAMANLPTIKVSKEMLGDNGKAECSICMDDVCLDDEVAQLPCKHWFHEQCVKAWLAEHDTCPHCRKGISDLAEQASTSSGRSASRREANGRAAVHRVDGLAERLANARVTGYQPPFPSPFAGTRRRSSGLGRSSRRPSEPASRRPSESAHGSGGGGGGGLLDRARNLFGGRRDS